MDIAERALLESTVSDAIASAETADATLAELGWLEMLASEPSDAIAIVFTALGAHNSSATPLDDVLVSALGVEPRPDRAFLLPAFGAWDPPGLRGIASSRITTATDLVVAGTDGITLVPASSVRVNAVQGIDPQAGMHVVERSTTGEPVNALDPAAWNAVVALAQRAIAHQIAGASRAMLDLARQHALDRMQFGRPIARFQAVRHRLADALVAIEALEATLSAAADDPGDDTAALAKITAGRTARTVATHCQQVLAGIGFTTDHPFHHYLKRTMLLDGLFGRADDLVVAIGHQLLAARRVPTLIEL